MYDVGDKLKVKEEKDAEEKEKDNTTILECYKLDIIWCRDKLYKNIYHDVNFSMPRGVES